MWGECWALPGGMRSTECHSKTQSVNFWFSLLLSNSTLPCHFALTDFSAMPGILFCHHLLSTVVFKRSLFGLKASEANPRVFINEVVFYLNGCNVGGLFVLLVPQVPYVQEESDYRFPLPHHHLLCSKLPGCLQQQRSDSDMYTIFPFFLVSHVLHVC